MQNTAEAEMSAIAKTVPSTKATIDKKKSDISDGKVGVLQ